MAHPGSRPVPGVGAALHFQKYGRATLDAKFRRGGFLHGQLGNCLRRKQGGGNTYYAGLVDGGIAIVAIVVVQAIYEVIVRSSAGAVNADGQKAAAGGALHPGVMASRELKSRPFRGTASIFCWST